MESPLTPLIDAADIENVWDELPLSHQRLVVDHLVTVRILPATRRGSGFDPASVDITWKDTACSQQLVRHHLSNFIRPDLAGRWRLDSCPS